MTERSEQDGDEIGDKERAASADFIRHLVVGMGSYGDAAMAEDAPASRPTKRNT